MLVKFSSSLLTTKDLKKSNFKIDVIGNNTNYDVEWDLETSIKSKQSIIEIFFAISKIDKPIVRETDKIEIRFASGLFEDEWEEQMEA